MYLKMRSELQIFPKSGGQLILGGINQPGAIQEIEIEQSVSDMNDKCTVTIPRNIKAFNGKSIRDYLTPGDRAYVYFGYDHLIQEFSGYILDVPATAPMTLELADEFYPLRHNTNTKSYPAVTLKQLLNDIAPGYKVVCPTVNLGKWVIDKSSTYQELKKISEKYWLHSYLVNGTLYCQFRYDVRGISPFNHTYYLCDDRTGKTAKLLGSVRSNDLKYKRLDAIDISVEVYSSPAKGKKIKAVAGSKIKGANLNKLYLPGGVSLKDAQQVADKIFNSISFDGFRGSITGYGVPRTNAGDSLTLIDFDYPDLNGTYLIEKVKKKYSDKGIERENTLSYKI